MLADRHGRRQNDPWHQSKSPAASQVSQCQEYHGEQQSLPTEEGFAGHVLEKVLSSVCTKQVDFLNKFVEVTRTLHRHVGGGTRPS